MFYLSIILSDPLYPRFRNSFINQSTFHNPTSFHNRLAESQSGLSISIITSTSTSNEPVKSLPGGAGLSTLNSALRFCYAFVTLLHLHYQLSSMDLFYSTNHLPIPTIACICIFFHTFIPSYLHAFIPPSPYLHPHTSTISIPISIPISTASYTSMHHDHFYLLGFFGL